MTLIDICTGAYSEANAMARWRFLKQLSTAKRQEWYRVKRYRLVREVQ
jgi:hypothetical protein